MDAATLIQKSYWEPPCVQSDSMDLDAPPQAVCWILPAVPFGEQGLYESEGVQVAKTYVVETDVNEPAVDKADSHAHSQNALLLAVSRQFWGLGYRFAEWMDSHVLWVKSFAL